MIEKSFDPWFKHGIRRAVGSPGAVPEEGNSEGAPFNKPSPEVSQQTLADLYEEWADSVPPENQAEHLKLCNRLRHLTHDSNDPLALILYTIGTSNKIHLLLPHKIQEQCQTVIHEVESRLDLIRGLHHQAANKLTETQTKLAAEFSALCDLNLVRSKNAFGHNLDLVNQRGQKLYGILDQQNKGLQKLQTDLVDLISRLLAKPVEQSKNNEALLYQIQEVVARVDVLFRKTYLTIILTFFSLIVAAFFTGIFVRPYL